MAGQASRENGKKGGRKKGYSAIQAELKRDLTARLLDKEWKPVVLAQIKAAKLGSVEAFKALRDTAYGKPKETLDANINNTFSLLDLGRVADKREKDDA